MLAAYRACLFSGEWRVASGEWRVASGEWRVASGGHGRNRGDAAAGLNQLTARGASSSISPGTTLFTVRSSGLAAAFVHRGDKRAQFPSAFARS
jgi:hypothetical protein